MSKCETTEVVQLSAFSKQLEWPWETFSKKGLKSILHSLGFFPLFSKDFVFGLHHLLFSLSALSMYERLLLTRFLTAMYKSIICMCLMTVRGRRIMFKCWTFTSTVQWSSFDYTGWSVFSLFSFVLMNKKGNVLMTKLTSSTSFFFINKTACFWVSHSGHLWYYKT